LIAGERKEGDSMFIFVIWAWILFCLIALIWMYRKWRRMRRRE